MFVLAVVEDKLKIVPEQFSRDSVEILTELIETNFVTKVLPDVGLCVSFYDFLDLGDPYIYPSEGSAHHLVRFRMVVFRPFVGEILTGKIVSCNKDGLKVSMGFFDDVFIPSSCLQKPSVYNESDGCWVWKYEENELPMDIGEEVMSTATHFLYNLYHMIAIA